MTKKKELLKSTDGMIELRYATDGSIAELKLNNSNQLLSDKSISDLLEKAEIKYGFKNAVSHCKDNNIERKAGEFFPIAIADDTSFEPDVEILLEPMDCLLSQRLYSLTDLERVRFIDAGEKLAKVKTGKGNIQSRNIFDRQIRDLSNDKNFSDTYLGLNVDFDKRRSLIIAKSDGYGLVENNKKISIINNIYLQQDVIEAGHEVKTSLTLDGSIFNSDLIVGGDLTVTGKIEGCQEKGILVSGNLTLESAEDSLLICKGDLKFREQLSNCQVFCNESVIGKENSVIKGGKIQSGISLQTGMVFSEENDTTLEVSIAPFYKALMIKLCNQLRQKEWDPKNPDTQDPLVKELEQLEIRFAKDIPKFLSDNRAKNKIICEKGFDANTHLRIFNVSQNIEENSELMEFTLE